MIGFSSRFLQYLRRIGMKVRFYRISVIEYDFTEYFYKINDINLDGIDVSFSNHLVDCSVMISNCIISVKSLRDIFDDKFIIDTVF